MLTLLAADPEAQERVGRELALVTPAQAIIYLHGDLGAGKTTLARGFLKGLGYEGAVKSPTYTLLEPYELGERAVYHFDLYRLADPGELEYLGLRDLLQSEAVLLFEWPEQGKGELPPADLALFIEMQGEGRRLRLQPGSERGRGIIQRLNRRITCGSCKTPKSPLP
jgi:tRNA threonylcarbamoyladenosine biosynthesis protein TsaE